jgi:hypothetical protein
MRESRTYGSGRGARGNSRPYRELHLLLRLLTAAFGTNENCRRASLMSEDWGTADLMPVGEKPPWLNPNRTSNNGILRSRLCSSIRRSPAHFDNGPPIS